MFVFKHEKDLDLNFFENIFFRQNFNIKFYKIIRRKFIFLKNIFSKIFSIIFQKYSKNISQKIVAKAVKK
jgi:hypothetical protein